jgi:hypothetical protein
MFEHFKAFLANKRNRTTIALVAGFLIFLAILKYFGLYEGFKPVNNSIRTADLYSSRFVTDNDLNPSTKGADLNLHRFKSKYEREEIMKKSLTNLQNDVAKASELDK